MKGARDCCKGCVHGEQGRRVSGVESREEQSERCGEQGRTERKRGVERGMGR